MPGAPNKPVGRFLSLKIVSIYAIVGGLWILLSDSILAEFVSSPQTIGWLSMAKGLAFILVTSLLLHALIRDGLASLRRSEMTLLDSERRLTDIINFLPDATFVVDTEGKIIAWNHAMEQISGVPAERMLGKSNREYSLPFYNERRPMLVDLIVDPNTDVSDLYGSIGREDSTIVGEAYFSDFGESGTYIWAKASPLYDSNGALVGAIEALRDVTERKRRVERERQIEAKAEEAKRAFYQSTIFSVTGGRLILVDHAEIEALMQDPDWTAQLSTRSGLTSVREQIAKIAEDAGVETERIYSLVTAVGEAAANAVKHADGGSASVKVLDDRIRISIRDKGNGMDQLMLPKATLLARFSTKASMGLGYSLILGLVDTVYLATDGDGTDVVMEQMKVEQASDISLDTLPDTW